MEATNESHSAEGGDFYNNWLGLIYIKAGCKWDDKNHEFEKDDFDIACRGSIIDWGLEEEGEDGIKGVVLYCETAWGPMNESFEGMLNKYYPGLRLQCRAEEPGCEIYLNTDTDHEYFTERWVIDSDDFHEYYAYDEENKFIDDLEYITGIKLKDICELDIRVKELEKAYKDKQSKKHGGSPEDYWISIHEYES